MKKYVVNLPEGETVELILDTPTTFVGGSVVEIPESFALANPGIFIELTDEKVTEWETHEHPDEEEEKK